jgi:hypothetical protein
MFEGKRWEEFSQEVSSWCMARGMEVGVGGEWKIF